MLTRTVIQDFYQHGSPWVGAEVSYTLKHLGFTSTLMYPRVTITVTSDADGRTSADLWPNAESLARTEYEASLPDGSKVDFVLPEGESEISLAALIIAARIPRPWNIPGLNELIDVRMDLEAALRIAGDAASAALVAEEAAIRARQIADIQAALFHATGVGYLFLDLVSNDDPAPLTLPKPATIGNWEGNDGEGIIYDLDGRRIFPVPATATSFVEEVMWTQDSFARTAGRALIMRITPATSTGRFRLGWDTSGVDIGRTPRTHALYVHESGTVRVIEESESLTSFAPYIADETYDFAVVQRARGAHYLMKTPDTEVWERLWVSFNLASGPLYGFISNFDAEFALEGVAEIRDLASPWNADAADALQYVAAASPGTYACDDNGLIQVRWTVSSGTTLEISPRYTDANNRLVLRCIADSDSIAMVDRSAGVETTPGASNTKTFDWVDGSTYIISLRVDDGTCQVFVGNTLIMAPIYATHSGVNTLHLSHAVDHLTFWPIGNVSLPEVTRFVRQRNEFWVDTITGDDNANTGADISVPLATVAAAAGRAAGSAAVIIHVNAPLSNPLREDLNWSSSRDISIVATDADEPWYWFASQKHTAGWTSLGGGIYSKYMPEFFTTNLQNVIVTSMTDADGFELRLDYPPGPQGGGGTTPAEGQAGWVSGTFMCYVHLPGGVDPNSHTIETPIANTAIQLSSGATMTVEDGNIRYANIYGIALSGAGEIVGTRMDASYCMTGNFATFVGSTGAMTLTLCDGVRADNDIYSVHGDATVTLLNCTGSYAGDEIASAHETAIMTIQGGRYHHAGSGGITSVNTSTMYVYDAEVDNNGLITPQYYHGGVSFFDVGVGGELLRSNIHDNIGPGIWVRAGSPAVIGTGDDINTSGVGHGNTLPDDLAGT